MRKSMVRKGLVIGIIVLFIGASIVPSISGDLSKEKSVDYLDENKESSVSGGNKSLGSINIGGSEPEQPPKEVPREPPIDFRVGLYYHSLLDRTVGMVENDDSHNILVVKDLTTEETLPQFSKTGAVSNWDMIKNISEGTMQYYPNSIDMYAIYGNPNWVGLYLGLGVLESPMQIEYISKTPITQNNFSVFMQHWTGYNADSSQSRGIYFDYKDMNHTYLIKVIGQTEYVLEDLSTNEIITSGTFGGDNNPNYWIRIEVTDVTDTDMHIWIMCHNNNPHILYDGVLPRQEPLVPPADIWVDDDFNSSTPGWGYDHFDSIQDGVDAVAEGGTVYVYNGTYHEHNIIINKNYLNLIGENKETTIIDADGYSQGLSIPEYRHHNFVSGLTVMNTTYVGIFIHSEPAHSGAHCDYNTISDCIVRDCTGVGGIRIIGRRWTCHADYNTVINCEVFNISGAGLLIHAGEGYSYYNQIINTKSYNNTVGIYVGESQTDGSIISNCTIFNNTEYGLKIVSSDTTVYHNNLLNNVQNTFDSGTNTWYNETLQEGSYYDDYSGEDNNGDGIGDTPYNISGDSNQDMYPLMTPYGPPHADFIYTINDRTVFVNASTSYDYDGDIINYEWFFGDGSGGDGPIEAHVYPDYGTYNVTLTVTDNDGKNNSITKMISLEDFIPPEIIDNTPTEGYTGDSFTFNATITDAGGIDTAWVTWWYDSTALSVELDYMGDDYYEKTITIQDTLDMMHYIIDANDTSNNSQSTGTKHVTIYDNDNPEITDVYATPSIQNIGGHVNVSATVIDNIEVDEVYLYILYPDMTVENLSITQNNINDTYYCNKTYQEPGIYTYHIWANDTTGNSNISSDYTFEIINQPPYIPSDPYPENGSTDVSIYVDLSWVGGDPDLDPVTYDVYFGTASPPPKVVSNQSSTIYNPGTLEYDTTYYWKIVAWDNHDAFAEGPVWNFTTEEEYVPEPDLYCEGSLYWDGVNSGEPVTGSFLVFNVGDPSSLLDWEIVDWPEWGTWAFTPDSGEDLTPEDGAVTVTVFVVAPDEEDTEFIGEVRIVNTENSDDYYVIPVYLRTPVSQQSFKSQSVFYQSYFEKLMMRFMV